MMNHHQARCPRCPRCQASLDEGPIVYRCNQCRRAIAAADVDTEYHAPAATRAAA